MDEYKRNILCYSILCEFYTPMGLVLGAVVKAFLTEFTMRIFEFILAMGIYIVLCIIAYSYLKTMTFGKDYDGFDTIDSFVINNSCVNSVSWLHVFTPIWVAVLSDYNVFFTICAILLVVLDNLDGKCFYSSVMTVLGFKSCYVKLKNHKHDMFVLTRHHLEEGDTVKYKDLTHTACVLWRPNN